MASLAAVGYLWTGFAIIWLSTALTAKRRLRRQSPGSRALESALLLAAYLLLLNGRVAVGPLAWHFLPHGSAAAWLGLVLTAAGFAFACWARYALGRNWSGVVSISEDHELVRRGPYAFVRNPIYSGILLATLGTAISFGRLSGLLAFLLAAIAFLHKSRLEERLLTQRFGEEYKDYRRHVNALIPFVL